MSASAIAMSRLACRDGSAPAELGLALSTAGIHEAPSLDLILGALAIVLGIAASAHRP